MRHFTRPSQIVRILAARILNGEELAKLLEIAKATGDMGAFHHTMGMALRNEFGLWKAKCPWTDSVECLINGVDYNPFHPDAVSGRILEAVWCRAQNSDYDLSYLDVAAPEKSWRRLLRILL